MILILGNTSDSLIYVKNMLRYSSTNEENGMLTSYIGKIYGKDVVVAETGLSSYSSQLVTSYLINKYNPYIVIYIGDGCRISSGLTEGDILLGSNVIISDIDLLHLEPSTSLYQVPGFKKELMVQDNLLHSVEEAATKVNILTVKEGALLSANTYPHDEKSLNFEYKPYLANNHTELAFDSQVGGIILSCLFYQVPLCPIITISSDLFQNKSPLESRKLVLKNTVDIGKIIVAFIVDLSSDEKIFIRSDFGNDLNKVKPVVPAPAKETK